MKKQIHWHLVVNTFPNVHNCSAPLLRELWLSAVVCCSAAQSCPTLCNPMDCGTPGLPVPHHLLDFVQVHVHCILVMPSNHQYFCHLMRTDESLEKSLMLGKIEGRRRRQKMRWLGSYQLLCIRKKKKKIYNCAKITLRKKFHVLSFHGGEGKKTKITANKIAPLLQN